MNDLRRYPAIAAALVTSMAVISAALAAAGATPWRWVFLAAALVLMAGAGAALAVASTIGKAASVHTEGPQR